MIDRNKLDGQLSGWVERILGEMQSHDISLEKATSKVRLQQLLKADFRGLIISMIHKFEGIPKNISTVPMSSSCWTKRTGPSEESGNKQSRCRHP